MAFERLQTITQWAFNDGCLHVLTSDKTCASDSEDYIVFVMFSHNKTLLVDITLRVWVAPKVYIAAIAGIIWEFTGPILNLLVSMNHLHIHIYKHKAYV